MIEKGTVVKSDSGRRRIRVDGFIKEGGQAAVYHATELNSGQKGVLKEFRKRFANGDTVKRIQFLLDQDFQTACPVLSGPIDVLNTRGLVGHYTPFVAGKQLEEFLVEPNSTFVEQMQLAIALAHAVNIMHSRRIAHGDLHAENVIINREGTVFRVHLIDLDNFNASGMPLPPCVGHNLYIAPELREALAKGRPAIPTCETDLFALGVMMHELLLLYHTSAGNDAADPDFKKAMCSGRWLLDQAAADRPRKDLGGYPVGILNADLARLFRSSLSLDPAMRPSAASWEATLWAAFFAIYCCPAPACGGPCVIDASKTKCPVCGTPFPSLTLRVKDKGRVLRLTNGATVVGRSELGGSQKVSVRHAIFRRVGPETWIESKGSNGTYRWNGASWTKMPENKPRLVQAGDRLRFGDVEAQLS